MDDIKFKKYLLDKYTSYILLTYLYGLIDDIQYNKFNLYDKKSIIKYMIRSNINIDIDRFDKILDNMRLEMLNTLKNNEYQVVLREYIIRNNKNVNKIGMYTERKCYCKLVTDYYIIINGVKLDIDIQNNCWYNNDYMAHNI